MDAYIVTEITLRDYDGRRMKVNPDGAIHREKLSVLKERILDEWCRKMPDRLFCHCDVKFRVI